MRTFPMKFSIRDLLLVTVIVAVVVGWWVDRSVLNRDGRTWKERAEIVADHLSSLGYEVRWLDVGVGIAHSNERLPTSSAPAANPPKE